MAPESIGQPVVKDPAKVERILHAALTHFAQMGYRSAKTDLIAADAKVSKGLLFHYFGTKEALYLATAQWVFQRLNEVADFSVWQNAPDLETMVTRALRYKIALQVDYKPEFAFAMSLYGGGYPKALAPEIKQLMAGEMQLVSQDLLGPVLDRMKLKPEVTPQMVSDLMAAMNDLIASKARPFLDTHPDAQVADLEWLVDEVKSYMRILEYGFIQQ